MIFVTGGTGLLGAHLLFDLVSKGNKVRALKRESSNIEVVKKVFGYYSNDSTLFDKIEWVEGNTLDIVSLDEALQAVKTVYHCAAVVSFNPKERDEMMKINIEGTANVVNACLHAGVEKLCHVSSTAALGKKQSGELIGNCGIRGSDENTFAGQLGYEVAPDYWGKGYATEAARAVLDFGFTKLKLERISAECVLENQRSCRVLEKLGMQQEGHLRHNEWMKGRWWDTLVYGVLRQEWEVAKKNE